MNIKSILNNDTYISGLIIGFLSPLVTLVLLVPLFRLIMYLSGNNHFVDNQGILLLSIIPNILILRYLFLKAHHEKSVKSLVALSTLLVILFFAFVHNHPFEFPL
jgi:hypothetical protein